ncbi:MAG: cob(I)yrinic acid a,c-diamide adenosyltransferase [Clostridia bacterium]|nr:cob(I)yrinic acid a,c-diamide adenosyltransferase [Clostridia bacterium]
MKIYTKKGDRGQTTLMSSVQISKSDERVNALGCIDELTSHLGMVKAITTHQELRVAVERVQRNLITVMAGIASQNLQSYVLPPAEVEFLEKEIDRAEDAFNRVKEFILPGNCELSARLDVARTVCRRAERAIAEMVRKFPTQSNTQKYINRLSDYLYMVARWVDYEYAQGHISDYSGRVSGPVPASQTPIGSFSAPTPAPTAAAPAPAPAPVPAPAPAPASAGLDNREKAVVDEVLRHMGSTALLSSKKAVALIEAVEKYAESIGKKAVIAVCNSQGNPIAVHVMDDAFLVSYEVAIKKAYTAVSVKMPTIELSKMVQPGQTFYGLQAIDKLITFGGGVPLKVGDAIVGGLGISGGTGEEDHALCEYGLRVFDALK